MSKLFIPKRYKDGRVMNASYLDDFRTALLAKVNYSSSTADSGINDDNIADNSIDPATKLTSALLTRGKLAIKTTGSTATLGMVALSSSCGTFSTNATTATDITNLSITITTQGGPILVMLVCKAGSTSGAFADRPVAYCKLLGTAATTLDLATLQLVSSSGSLIGLSKFGRETDVTATTPELWWPLGGTHWTLAGLAAGTYTFKMQAYVAAATTTLTLKDHQLMAVEL